MRVSAKHIDGDTWQVSLPKRKSAIKGKDGVRPRRYVHATDEADAIRQGEELFTREYASYKMGVTLNLADLAMFFFDHAGASGELSEDTAKDYRDLIARYVEPNFSKDVDQVTPIDIEQLYSFLLSSGGKSGEGIAPNTVNKLNTALRKAYAFIVRENPAIPNPMPSVNPPARTYPNKRSLTEREFVKVLEGLEAALQETPEDAKGIKRRNMLFGVYLAIHTGARVGEICAITRGDIRTMEQAARIEHSMSDKGGLHQKEPKTDAGRRTVALDHDAWETLRRHYEWQGTYLTGKQKDSDKTPVCSTADGSFIAPKAMSAAFKELCASVGVELEDGYSIHTLRHTHATQLLSNKANPKAVQQRLGHARIETTFGYSHVMPGEDAATADDYGEIVARARKAGDFG